MAASSQASGRLAGRTPAPPRRLGASRTQSSRRTTPRYQGELVLVLDRNQALNQALSVNLATAHPHGMPRIGPVRVPSVAPQELPRSDTFPFCHGYPPLHLGQVDGVAHRQEPGTVGVQVITRSTHRGIGVIGGQETARVGRV